MKCLIILLSIIFYQEGFAGTCLMNYKDTDTPLIVHRCDDFILEDSEQSGEWQKAPWVAMNKIDKGGKDYATKFKMMYSSTGIYVMFNGEDEKITSDFKNDFENLFKADVFEVFFHPFASQQIYFEYEISPLNKELVLLILNLNGKMGAWMPWHYEGKKKVIKKVTISGGKMAPGAALKGWSAKLFFPYGLFDPLMNVPPVSGMRWNANFCRLDYDSGHMIKWSWSPIKVSFHEYEKFFPIQFE